MLALLTSCGRFDLLTKTLESLYENQQSKFHLTINEDGLSRIGQHKSIENFLDKNESKYYLHLEEDWLFENTYDWIAKSIEIMESDPTIIKVLCRSDSPHTPKVFTDGWGFIEPWQNTDSIWWCGFSWNPGITRLDLLKQFIPFKKWEQDVAEDIYNKGFKIAMLEKGVCKHIGDGRSTH